MSQTSIALKFRPSDVKGNKGSLILCLIKNRKSKNVTLPYKIYTEDWDADTSSLRINNDNPSHRQYLSDVSETIQKKMEEIREKIHYLEDKGGYTVDEIVECHLDYRRSPKLSLIVAKLQKDLRSKGQVRAAEAYQTTMNKVLSFYEKGDFPLNKLDYHFVQDFEADMREKENSLNTISFYMRNLRAIYNKAIQKKIISRKGKNPFEGAYTQTINTRKYPALGKVIEELGNMELSERNQQSLMLARDLFSLSFYLKGISFTELAYLKKSDLNNGVLTYHRYKTKQLLHVTLTPEVESILNRYADQCLSSKYLLPILETITVMKPT